MDKLEKFVKMVCGFALMIMPILLIAVIVIPNAVTLKLLLIDLVVFASLFVVTWLLYE